jgi:hypothetical protein
MGQRSVHDGMKKAYTSAFKGQVVLELFKENWTDPPERTTVSGCFSNLM